MNIAVLLICIHARLLSRFAAYIGYFPKRIQVVEKSYPLKRTYVASPIVYVEPVLDPLIICIVVVLFLIPAAYLRLGDNGFEDGSQSVGRENRGLSSISIVLNSQK